MVNIYIPVAEERICKNFINFYSSLSRARYLSGLHAGPLLWLTVGLGDHNCPFITKQQNVWKSLLISFATGILIF